MSYNKVVSYVGDIMKFEVIATKQDSSISKHFHNCFLIDETDEDIIFSSYNCQIIPHKKPPYINKYKSLWIFPKNEWFNIVWYFNNDRAMYYINIASPVVKQDEAYSYIDYELDLVVNHDFSYSVIDFKEFNRNRLKMNYSQEVVNNIFEATNKIKGIIESKQKWFSQDWINDFLEKIKVENIWKKTK